MASQDGPMHSSMDGFHQGQVVFELNAQKSRLQRESHARLAAEQQATASKTVANDLLRKLQLKEQVGTTAAAARAHDDSAQYIEDQMSEALATIIKLRQDAQEAQERIDKIQNLHIIS